MYELGRRKCDRRPLLVVMVYSWEKDGWMDGWMDVRVDVSKRVLIFSSIKINILFILISLVAKKGINSGLYRVVRKGKTGKTTVDEGIVRRK